MTQQCDNNITTISQQCHNNITKISQQYHNNATTMINNVKTMSQQCHNNVTTISQQCHNNVTTMLVMRMGKQYKTMFNFQQTSFFWVALLLFVLKTATHVIVYMCTVYISHDWFLHFTKWHLLLCHGISPTFD